MKADKLSPKDLFVAKQLPRWAAMIDAALGAETASPADG